MESSNFIKGYGKANPLEDQASTQNPKTAKKSNATIVISLTLILTLIVGALIGALIHESASESHSSKPQSSPSSSAPSSSTPSSSFDSNSAESLKTVCAVTQHPDSCFTTISSLNNPPKADPVHFYNLSLQVTIQELKNVSSLPKSLISRSNDKGTESALKDCISLFDDAMSQLSNTFDEMIVGPNERVLTEMKISDMDTWISAAMTDQETCLEGLEEMESSLVDEVKVKVQKSKDYMGNSLAILNNMESLLQKFGMTMP